MTIQTMGAVVTGRDLSNYTTVGNAYADAVALSVRVLATKHLTFKATTNTLELQILGSQDGGITYPTTVEAAFDVTAAAQVLKTVTAFYTHLKVQVRPKVGGNHGTLTTWFNGASF